MTSFNPANQLSRRTSAVEEAAIIVMAGKARQLKAQGKDVISLTLGEPDFDTPRHIRDAATKAMNDGFTHYAPVPGMADIKQALSEKLKAENNLDYAPNEIIMSNGAKQSFTNAIFATIDPGDEVILLAPYWVAYEGIIKMAGGVPIIVQSGADEGFKPPAERIAAAITDKTRLLVINSPCNPSGAMFTRSELENIAAIVLQHPHLMVISDEIYEYITFDEEHFSIGSLPDMIERTITINGFSKGFAMTGWRLGYSAGPAPIAAAMSKVQGALTAGANAFVQKAAISALTGPRDDVETMRQSYLERRNLVVSALEAIKGISLNTPPGTFYAFPDISSFFGKTSGNTRINDCNDMCNWLLEEHLVATVPGSAFGNETSLRISFAASVDDLKLALERITRALNSLA